MFWRLSSAEILLRFAEIAYDREVQLHWKVFKHSYGIWIWSTSIKECFEVSVVLRYCWDLLRLPMNEKYSCIEKFSNTCSEYEYDSPYSEQEFENFSMELYFPFIGNPSKSQQYLSNRGLTLGPVVTSSVWKLFNAPGFPVKKWMLLYVEHVNIRRFNTFF